MGKAAQLLRQIVEPSSSTKAKAATKIVVDPLSPVIIPTFGRQTTAKAAARYFRILDKRKKALETELNVIKAAIRTLGQEHLDIAFCDNKYYAAADVGGVKVTRANKFSPVDVDPNALRDAVGESYGAMFQEDCVLRFDSLDEMRQFIRTCELAGVEVVGKPEALVRGRSGLLQRIAEIGAGLDSERRALLMACAKDQQPRVGGR